MILYKFRHTGYIESLRTDYLSGTARRINMDLSTRLSITRNLLTSIVLETLSSTGKYGQNFTADENIVLY